MQEENFVDQTILEGNNNDNQTSEFIEVNDVSYCLNSCGIK